MDRGEVGRAERVAVAPADDDDGRDTVSAGKLCPERVGPCRLGAGRHRYRRLLARGVVADQRHKAPETTITKSASTHEKRLGHHAAQYFRYLTINQMKLTRLC